MSLISRVLGRQSDGQAAVRPLWHGVVKVAREKAWYARYGVADTVAGRFDAVTLVFALVLLRMERARHVSAGPNPPRSDDPMIAASARLTELFVEDMDGQLRQSGIGDLVVGKRMGRLMSVLGGRIGALRDAFRLDDAALIGVLERNVTLVEGADVPGLAQQVRQLHARIEALSDEDLLAARI